MWVRSCIAWPQFAINSVLDFIRLMESFRYLNYMDMHQIINYFTDDDLYKFTMCCAVIENYPRTKVKYKLIDRNKMIYPCGFAEELRQQIQMLEDIVITDEEIAFMESKCTYIPKWFYSYLKGFRYNSDLVKVIQDATGHLEIEIEGYWSETILFEVKLLAIISELYYRMTGLDKEMDYSSHSIKSYDKAKSLIEAGCVFSDFGTRRRASFKAQDIAVGQMCKCNNDYDALGLGKFAGTSNVYLAMKYGLTPIGTMAHEFVCAIAGMYGPQMANHIAMETWAKTYRGALGTFLYDTYGWRIFSLNFSEDFANMFKGLRVDSGDNYEELNRIIEKYHSLNIDSTTKQIVFSNGLDVKRAIAINDYAKGKCLPSFGIGTHFTNDFENIAPMNIVIKLMAVKITESWPFYCQTCKLSEDKGKYSGDNEIIERFIDILHLNEP